MKLLNIHNRNRKVYLFTRDKDGELEITQDSSFYPYYYEPDREGTFNTYDNNTVRRVICDIPREVAQMRSDDSYEADILFPKRYIIDNIPTLEKTTVKYLFLDIEILTKDMPDVNKADKPISCISIYNSFYGDIQTWFLGDYPSEEDMLEDFMSYIGLEQPDLILAWNVQFDYTYLCNRIMDFAEKISPIHQTRFGSIRELSYPAGISIMDYMYMFKKIYMREPSYALDSITKKYLGAGKVHKEIDFSVLNDDIKHRNREDVELMAKLENQFKLLDYYDEIRRFSTCLWEDLTSNSLVLDMIMLREAGKRKIILPNKRKREDNEDDGDLQGAYRRADVGVYKNIYKADVACVDTSTEILTKHGFRKWHEISMNDEPLTLNIDTNKLEYKNVKNLFISNYEGKMIHIKGRSTDQLLTPNHRVLLQRRERYKKPFHWKDYEFKRADEVSTYTKLPLCAEYEGDYYVSDDIIKSCAWIITEGSILEYGTIKIFQSEINNENCKEIMEVLENLDIPFKIRDRKRGEYKEYSFTIKAKYGREILKNYLYEHKELTSELLNLSLRQSRLLLKTLVKGDGSTKNRVNGSVYVTNNSRLADQVLELSLKCGYRSSCYRQVDYRLKDNRNIYYIYSSFKDIGFTIQKKEEDITEVDYKGIVWCLETENQTIVCRRNGKVFITGNSMYPNQLINFCLDTQNIKDEPSPNTINIEGVDVEQNKDALLPYISKMLIGQKNDIKKELKKLKHDDPAHKLLQNKYDACKSLVNSLYGVMAFPTFRLYNFTIASSITFLSRDLLQYTERVMQEEGYDVIYSDTDAVMYKAKEDKIDYINTLVGKWALEKFNKKDIDITFESEGMFDKLLILGKCHYYGWMGTKKEIKGMEIKRSSSSKYESWFQETLINYILNEKSKEFTISWIKAEHDRIKTLPIREVGFPCKIANKKYKNEPIFVRAYNNTRIIDPSFKVNKGEVFKYIYVKPKGYDANEKPMDVLAFNGKITPDMEVDWDEVIRRNITMKVNAIFEMLGWGKIEALMSNQLRLF